MLMISTASFRCCRRFKFRATIQNQEYLSQTIPKYKKKLIPSLKSCTQPSQIYQIHAQMIKTGLDLITFNLSKLLASSIRDIDYARSIFDRIQNPNLFMFNTMLRGYSISQNSKEALFLFNLVRAQGVWLDQFSFISTLKACTREFFIGFGKCVHGIVIGSGFEFYVNIRNALLHFYCVCGRIEEAQQLFDEMPHTRDTISWNVLMGGYLQISRFDMVVEVFLRMLICGFGISIATAVIILSVPCHVRDFQGGESLHSYCIKSGFCSDLNVMTAIISMYAKFKCMNSARKLFDQMPNRDVVIWNCIIDGYAKSGFLNESFALLRLMKSDRVKPNSATLAGLLSACASSGALGIGQCIHKYVKEELLELDAVLGTALIDMYSKCGSIKEAIEVFELMASKDVMSWTAMIDGFGVNGLGENAIKLFYKMEEQGLRPNEVTFLAVLSACSHGGLVLEGRKCFDRMSQEYGLTPKIEHYGCMVDLLGRAGLLEEAHRMVRSSPLDRDVTAWRALLSACRVHGNVAFGEFARRSLMELDANHPTDSILLSSTYAMAMRGNDAARIRSVEDEVMKEAGCSSIELDG